MSYVTRKITFFAPVKTALSGQAFRITKIDDDHTELVARGRYLQIASLGDDMFAFSCDEKEFCDIWEDHLDLRTDYGKIVSSVRSDDTYLKEAAEYGRGIRILRQEVFETIISYIISQRRSIPSITTCVNRISKIAGNRIIPVIPQGPFAAPLQDEYYSFPDASSILAASDKLDDAGLGYRLPYVLSACRDWESGKITEEMLKEADDDKLYKILTDMYGVGTKVANCIMLFALHRTGRFPVDVWIKRIEDKYYGGPFDTSPYPETAGIMQQFMFFYERTKG